MLHSKSRITASLSLILLGSPISAQVTQRASVSSSEAQGDDGSSIGSFSADGRYVAFSSSSTNLVPGDTNGSGDSFIRDRWTGSTERVSVATGGAEANLGAGGGSISADGRYVAFSSGSSNLVPGDTNGTGDVFVRDRLLGVTTRVSVSTGGTQADMDCSSASISADGRYVAFNTFSSTLVGGDTNLSPDVFVHDRQTGTTERVSLSSGGLEGNHNSGSPSISADGRYVAFYSFASNLVPADLNGTWDVFVRDRQTGTTERVSVSTGGTEADDISATPSIAADGRYVVFTSLAGNLVGGDVNAKYDVFVRDRQSSTTVSMSVTPGGVQGNGDSQFPSFSADGRYVAFRSEATNLVNVDTNGLADFFVRHREIGVTVLASVSSTGTQASSLNAGTPVLSADGRYVGFSSHATNLVSGDTNASIDVFVHDRDATGFTSRCHPGLDGVINCPCSNPPSDVGSGCDNHGAGPQESGTLIAIGVAYLESDSLVLQASGENNTSLTVFFTGSGSFSPTGVAHGAGVRCVASGLKRLYTGNASGGTISRPGAGDLSVSARTAAVGAPISGGETRHYFAIYRDPNAAGPCGFTSSTINLTNAGSVAWNL